MDSGKLGAASCATSAAVSASVWTMTSSRLAVAPARVTAPLPDVVGPGSVAVPAGTPSRYSSTTPPRRTSEAWDHSCIAISDAD